MDSFDGKFINEAMREFAQSVMNYASRQKISLRCEGDFGKVSLKDAVRLVGMVQGDPTSEETTELRDKVARQLLVKVDVSFYQDDVKVGSLARITDAGQSLESDAFLQDNWIFYQLVLDVTTGHVLKNFTAPPKPIPPAAGAVPGAELRA
jgi:hypothetical protein